VAVELPAAVVAAYLKDGFAPGWGSPVDDVCVSEGRETSTLTSVEHFLAGGLLVDVGEADSSSFFGLTMSAQQISRLASARCTAQ
jgi:hypothetical protein